jgi:hypothetical protein
VASRAERSQAASRPEDHREGRSREADLGALEDRLGCPERRGHREDRNLEAHLEARRDQAEDPNHHQAGHRDRVDRREDHSRRLEARREGHSRRRLEARQEDRSHRRLEVDHQGEGPNRRLEDRHHPVGNRHRPKRARSRLALGTDLLVG